MVESAGRRAWEADQSIATELVVVDGHQLGLLRRKLAEYRERPAAKVADLAALDVGAVVLHGFEAVDSLMKQTVFGIVIDLADAPDRDTHQLPITIAEVAAHFRMRTGIDVSEAVVGPDAVRFEYVPDKAWHLPYTDLQYDGTDSLATMYATTFGIARAYAGDRLDVLSGGTGLPNTLDITTQELGTTE